MNKLKGKKVIITGASSGIGRSAVLEFAKQEVKAIILVSRNKARLAQISSEISEKTECMIFGCDISSKSEVIRMAREVLSVYDTVDILVNNAGIGILGKVANQSIEDLELLKSAYNLDMNAAYRFELQDLQLMDVESDLQTTTSTVEDEDE